MADIKVLYDYCTAVFHHMCPFLIFSSENYLIRWGDKGFPKDVEMLNNLKVVFTVSQH